MIITIIVGFMSFIFGACVGCVLMSLMVAASRDDRRRELEE